MEELYYLIAAAIGFVVGWRINSWFTVMNMRSILDDLGITPEQMQRLHDHARKESGQDDLRVIVARLELMNGVLYCWAKDTGAFLGQGESAQQLIEILADKHVGYRILIAESDGGTLLGGTSFNYDVATKELKNDDTR
jgi:hypothetical protein